MKVLVVLRIEFDQIVVEKFRRFFVFGRFADAKGEKHRQSEDLRIEISSRERREEKTDLQRLNDEHRGEETAHGRGEPLPSFHVAELDSTGDDEKRRQTEQNRREAVSDEQTPPGKHPAFLPDGFLRHEVRHGLVRFHRFQGFFQRRRRMSNSDAAEKLDQQNVREEREKLDDQSDDDLKRGWG